MNWSERRKEIVELAESGKTAEEIARTIGCTVGNLHYQIHKMRKNGIYIPKLKHSSLKYGNQIVSEWRGLLRSGLKQKQVAEMYGLQPAFVSQKLSKQLFGELSG